MDIARLSTEELQAEEVVGASLLAKLGIREQARSHDGAPAMSLRATLFRNFGVVVLEAISKIISQQDEHATQLY